MTYAPSLREELSFGDVCEAEFLFDVHVRQDARQMGRDVTPRKFALKKWGVDEEVAYFLPGVGIRANENYVLAHGTNQQAVVLSDDCLIATVLGRDGDGPTSRRLLFAPLVEATEDQVQELAEGNFGRFPLRADDHHGEHHIADLRRCFMAGARDVHEALASGAFRLRSLDEGTLDELAIRWSAYALRRGPFVAEDNMEKFALHLVDSGRVADDEEAVGVASKLVDVVAAAWGYEGNGVEGAGAAAEAGRDPQEVIDDLVRRLEQLRDGAADALDAVRAI